MSDQLCSSPRWRTRFAGARPVVDYAISRQYWRRRPPFTDRSVRTTAVANACSPTITSGGTSRTSLSTGVAVALQLLRRFSPRWCSAAKCCFSSQPPMELVLWNHLGGCSTCSSANLQSIRQKDGRFRGPMPDTRPFTAAPPGDGAAYGRCASLPCWRGSSKRVPSPAAPGYRLFRLSSSICCTGALGTSIARAAGALRHRERRTDRRHHGARNLDRESDAVGAAAVVRSFERGLEGLRRLLTDPLQLAGRYSADSFSALGLRSVRWLRSSCCWYRISLLDRKRYGRSGTRSRRSLLLVCVQCAGCRWFIIDQPASRSEHCGRGSVVLRPARPAPPPPPDVGPVTVIFASTRVARSSTRTAPSATRSISPIRAPDWRSAVVGYPGDPGDAGFSARDRILALRLLIAIQVLLNSRA